MGVLNELTWVICYRLHAFITLNDINILYLVSDYVRCLVCDIVHRSHMVSLNHSMAPLTYMWTFRRSINALKGNLSQLICNGNTIPEIFLTCQGVWCYNSFSSKSRIRPLPPCLMKRPTKHQLLLPLWWYLSWIVLELVTALVRFTYPSYLWGMTKDAVGSNTFWKGSHTHSWPVWQFFSHVWKFRSTSPSLLYTWAFGNCFSVEMRCGYRSVPISIQYQHCVRTPSVSRNGKQLVFWYNLCQIAHAASFFSLVWGTENYFLQYFRRCFVCRQTKDSSGYVSFDLKRRWILPVLTYRSSRLLQTCPVRGQYYFRITSDPGNVGREKVWPVILLLNFTVGYLLHKCSFGPWCHVHSIFANILRICFL